jgi:hypothetical protein
VLLVSWHLKLDGVSLLMGSPVFLLVKNKQRRVIMTKLYPIGTQLITRRLSQAALAGEEELFDDFSSYIPVPETYTDESETVAASFVMKWRPFFYSYADKWRVTVTEDNQPWLSPVPMVGDYVHFNRLNFGFLVDRVVDEVFVSNEPCFFAAIEDEPEIITRLYPNGQRAPMIECDKVILPETEGE